MYAWEPSFEARILSYREKELDTIKYANYINAFGSMCWLLSPYLVGSLGRHILYHNMDGLIYWRLTPQQQPGSYRGVQMMMMKSVNQLISVIINQVLVALSGRLFGGGVVHSIWNTHN